MKRLLAYLFLVLGLGLVLSVNVNAAKNNKVDYLCISENKNNKKQYVKHSDDEFLFQVFYKKKLLNLKKNKVCTYKIFSTDPIFQGLFNTLTHKSVGRKVKVDSSWGITKIIKKTIFLDRFENLKKYAQKNERRNICISGGNQVKKKYKVYFKGQTFDNKNGKSETLSCKENISISHYYYPNHYKKIKDLLYKKNQTEWGWKTFTKEEIINALIETRILEDKEIQIAKAEPSQTQIVVSKDQKHLCVNEFNEKLMRVDKILKDQNNKCKYKFYRQDHSYIYKRLVTSAYPSQLTGASGSNNFVMTGKAGKSSGISKEGFNKIIAEGNKETGSTFAKVKIKSKNKSKVKKITYKFCVARMPTWHWTDITMTKCKNNEEVSIDEFIKVRLTRVTGSEPDNRKPDQRFFEELDKLLVEFKTYGISEAIIYDTIEKDRLLASLNKQKIKVVQKKAISTNDWYKWVETYPSALVDGVYLSATKEKGIRIIEKININSEAYVPDAVNDHFKYFTAVKEQVNYDKYNGNKYKVLAAARNYYARFMLAGGYHKDLKTAASLALKNCKKQMDTTYPLTECVIVMIGNEKITYKEQGYWSEVILKKPTLIKKYYDTIGSNKFDQNYLARNFLNDQKAKFNLSNKRIVKNNSKEEFKPKKSNQDKEAPIIEIAEVITVNDTDYEFQGKVTDQAKTIYVEVDGRPTDVKNGKFIVKGYSPIDKQISIEAIDQWGNRSEPKIVKLKIDIKDTIVAEKLEPLNPSKIRSKSSNDKVALIIGIENYLESPNAKYANLDAKYFFDYARKGFGVKKQNINLLVDEDATFVKTNKALTKWLRSKIKSGQSDLIIFFAGHGLASNDGKELYLLPQDSDPDLLSRTALSRTELFQEIIGLNPNSVTMFLDTCYSGVSRDEKMLLASARPIRIVSNEEQDIPDNFTIFSASQLDQISSGIKEAKHGIFSYYLMKGLEGYADANKDKNITNGELLAYMDENVSQKASELGRQQNPSLAGDPDKVLMSYR